MKKPKSHKREINRPDAKPFSPESEMAAEMLARLFYQQVLEERRQSGKRPETGPDSQTKTQSEEAS